MAGEVKGKIYESIVYFAAERVVKETENIQGKVLWHQQPEWITINADITIGLDKDNIEKLIMVTHSLSEKDSTYKSLRNIGELFQWKSFGPNKVDCYSISFESEIKPSWKVVGNAFLDGVLELSKTEYGRELINFVNSNLHVFQKSHQACLLQIEKMADPNSKEFDPIFGEVIHSFSGDLKQLIQKRNSNINPLWELSRKISNQKNYVSDVNINPTFLRKGISQLMLCPKDIRSLIYESIDKGTTLSKDDIPEYLLSAEVLVSRLGRLWVSRAVKSAVNLIGEEGCEFILNKAPHRMNQYLQSLST